MAPTTKVMTTLLLLLQGGTDGIRSHSHGNSFCGLRHNTHSSTTPTSRSTPSAETPYSKITTRSSFLPAPKASVDVARYPATLVTTASLVAGSSPGAPATQPPEGAAAAGATSCSSLSSLKVVEEGMLPWETNNEDPTSSTNAKGKLFPCFSF